MEPDRTTEDRPDDPGHEGGQADPLDPVQSDQEQHRGQRLAEEGRRVDVDLDRKSLDGSVEERADALPGQLVRGVGKIDRADPGQDRDGLPELRPGRGQPPQGGRADQRPGDGRQERLEGSSRSEQGDEQDPQVRDQEEQGRLGGAPRGGDPQRAGRPGDALDRRPRQSRRRRGGRRGGRRRAGGRPAGGRRPPGRWLIGTRLRALHSGILYSRIWEDDRVDRLALAIQPGDRVLVVASAGDVALLAALDGAGEVVAVDRNPAQLHLLELKLAALRTLDATSFWTLFGEGRAPLGPSWYDRLRPGLPPLSQRFWDRHARLFEIGLRHQSRVELGLLILGPLIRRLVGRRGFDRILDAPDARVQGRLYARRYARRVWNPVTRRLVRWSGLLALLTMNRQQWRLVVGDRFLEGFEDRVGDLLERELIRDNPFWCLVLTGQPTDPKHEVAYLLPEAFDRLTERASSVRPRLGSLLEVLSAEPDDSLDAIDLLDVPDWLAPAERRSVWVEVGRVLRPGGRCLARSISRHPDLPGPASGLVLDAALSVRLTAIERTAVYGSVAVFRTASASRSSDAD